MEPPETDQHEFYPKGAIAFFVALILLFLVLWFIMYFEVLGRI